MVGFYFDGNMEKRRMENTSMHVYRFKNSVEKTYFNIDVEIHKFFKLKYNTWYGKKYSTLDCHLSISKGRRGNVKLLFMIRNSHLYIVECFLFYTEDLRRSCVISDKIAAETTPGRPFEINLPSMVIYDEKNTLIKRGILVLKLEIFRGEEPRRMPRPCYNSRIRPREKNVVLKTSKGTITLRLQDFIPEDDPEKLVDDLLDMFDKQLFMDFVMFGEDDFEVHKALLAARSKFFRDHINEYGGSIDLNVPGSVLSEVIRFMYCGQVFATDVKLVLKIVEVAAKFKIGRLVELCVNFLKCNTDYDNADRLMEIGYSTGLEELVKAADVIQATTKTKKHFLL